MIAAFIAMRFLLIIAVMSRLAASGSQVQPLDEYQVKAAFLYNFAKFVEWPAEGFQSGNEPIVICVLGSDPFGHDLENAVKGKAIDGHPLTTRKIKDLKQISGCRILFATAPERKPISPIFAAINGQGLLTVGESDDPNSSGAIINFTLENGKVRFEVNVETAEREKVRLSSKLLSLARNFKR